MAIYIGIDFTVDKLLLTYDASYIILLNVKIIKYFYLLKQVTRTFQFCSRFFEKAL